MNPTARKSSAGATHARSASGPVATDQSGSPGRASPNASIACTPRPGQIPRRPLHEHPPQPATGQIRPDVRGGEQDRVRGGRRGRERVTAGQMMRRRIDDEPGQDVVDVHQLAATAPLQQGLRQPPLSNPGSPVAHTRWAVAGSSSQNTHPRQGCGRSARVSSVGSPAAVTLISQFPMVRRPRDDRGRISYSPGRGAGGNQPLLHHPDRQLGAGRDPELAHDRGELPGDRTEICAALPRSPGWSYRPAPVGSPRVPGRGLSPVPPAAAPPRAPRLHAVLPQPATDPVGVDAGHQVGQPPAHTWVSRSTPDLVCPGGQQIVRGLLPGQQGLVRARQPLPGLSRRQPGLGGRFAVSLHQQRPTGGQPRPRRRHIRLARPRWYAATSSSASRSRPVCTSAWTRTGASSVANNQTCLVTTGAIGSSVMCAASRCPALRSVAVAPERLRGQAHPRWHPTAGPGGARRSSIRGPIRAAPSTTYHRPSR